MTRKNFLLTSISFLAIALTAEAGLRILEHTRMGSDKFNLLPAATFEHFYFFSGLGADRNSYGRGPHDPLLGWRNNGRPVINKPGNKDSLNSDGWRGPEFTRQKNKRRRIVLIGDSFSYGFMVDDSETLATRLEQELGDDTEVYAMAVPAYGIDQMALVATRIAPEYHPDAIIVAFIAADFSRSCSAFNFNLRKPYFEMGKNGVELRGVPVATPRDVLAEHNRLGARIWDGVVATATHSRVVCLLGQVALQARRRNCLDNLNPAIFQYICDKSKPGTRLIFAHLDGELPPGVETKLRQMPAEYVSVPPMVRSLSASTGIPAERFRDLHPRPNLIRLYSMALAETLRAKMAP